MKKILKIIGGLLGAVVVLILGLAAFVFVTLRPSLPDTEFTLAPPTMTGGYNVLVFGATGKLGTEIVQDLTAQGDRVTAFVRSSSDRSQLEPLGAEFAVGDVLDAASVLAAFEGGEYDAVISTIAGMAVANLDSQGNINVFDAAAAADVSRVIFISSVGAGDSYESAPLLSRVALADVLPQKTLAEDHLKTLGLDYTIVRPGGLPPGIVATERGILSEDASTMGFIKRPDLARLIVAILYDDNTVGKTLAAVDPELQRPWDGGDP